MGQMYLEKRCGSIKPVKNLEYIYPTSKEQQFTYTRDAIKYFEDYNQAGKLKRLLYGDKYQTHRMPMRAS